MVSLEPPDCIVLETKRAPETGGNAQTISQNALALCLTWATTVSRVMLPRRRRPYLARAQTHSLFNVSLHAGTAQSGFNQRNLERLSNMGIYTLGQLIQLPHAGLGKRFSQCLTRYLGRLQGQLPTHDRVYDRQSTFSSAASAQTYPQQRSAATWPMPYLTKQLEHWLITHQQGCIAELAFCTFKGEDTRLVIRLGQVNNATKHTEDQCAKTRNIELPSEVLTGLDITVSQPWLGNNQDLFGSTASATLAISELVDELRARLAPTRLLQHTNPTTT